MAIKAKVSSRGAALPVENWAGWSPATPSLTLEERLQRIQAMGERIAGIIRFMCEVGNLTGTSAEAKDLAVAAFYERMVIVERELSRIKEDLRLG